MFPSIHAEESYYLPCLRTPCPKTNNIGTKAEEATFYCCKSRAGPYNRLAGPPPIFW